LDVAGLGGGGGAWGFLGGSACFFLRSARAALKGLLKLSLFFLGEPRSLMVEL
jgi:hypothetical protein